MTGLPTGLISSLDMDMRTKTSTSLNFGNVSPPQRLQCSHQYVGIQVSGSVGCIFSIDDMTHDLLRSLITILFDLLASIYIEYNFLSVLHGFTNRTLLVHGFIDGDLLQIFSRAPMLAQSDIVNVLNQWARFSKTNYSDIQFALSSFIYLPKLLPATLSHTCMRAVYFE